MSRISVGEIIMYICIAIGAVYVAAVRPVYAGEPYLELGVARGEAQLAVGGSRDCDVAWQQCGYPHHEGLTDTVYSIGLGYQLDSTLSVVARAQSGMAVTVHGEWGKNDDGSSVEGGSSLFADGGAQVKGISLTGIAKLPVYKNVSVGVEGGAFFWQSAFRVKISQPGYDHGKGRVWYAEPVKTKGVGSVVGGLISYKQFDVKYTCYKVEPHDGNFNAVCEAGIAYNVIF